MTRQLPTLYTQNRCPDSANVIHWPHAHDVAFVERDVSTGAKAAAALIATGTLVTPLLVTERSSVFGFNPAQVDEIESGAHSR